MIEKILYNEQTRFKDYSVTLRKDGRCFCRIPISIDRDNKKYIYKSFYGVDRFDVKSKVDDYIKERIKAQNSELMTEELLTTDIEKWLYSVKYGTIKNSYFDRLEEIYIHQINPILPELSQKLTKNFKTDDCRQLLEKNLHKGYSYSTILKIYRLLHEFFQYQTVIGKIAINPMGIVKMYTKEFVRTTQDKLRNEQKNIKEKIAHGIEINNEELILASSLLKMEDKKDIRFLDDDEIERIKNVAYNGYYIEYTAKSGKQIKSGPYNLKQAKFFIFILNTGLRKGEAIGLKYSDVDFDNKTVTIERNISSVKNRDKAGKSTGGLSDVTGNPKTKESKTTIPINDTAVRILKEMLAEEADGYLGYIANDNGKQIGQTAIKKRFDSLLRQANVEHCGIHSLRHTFASKLYEATNGDSKLVSELVRHSSVSFTEDIYIHLKEKYKKKTISTFEI